MNEQTTPPLSPDTQAMLDCLRLTVSKTLERKNKGVRLLYFINLITKGSSDE